jgi:hypothetical protein
MGGLAGREWPLPFSPGGICDAGAVAMRLRKFAESTDVPVSKTKAELEDLLTQHGATSTAVFNSPEFAAIAFEMASRRVVIKLNLPNPKARQFTHGRINQHAGEIELTAERARARHEKACRQKWRALLLAVKAKLVSVQEGVETFEDAFMAHFVMPDGQTVADHVRPRIATAYREQRMAPLLPRGGGNA